ncbi:MAG: cupin domain-containing protein [Cyanobacteria bacterium K_Offshore_surface_m2_239]|nr:cupin domain-containing protein [Cyanobacteria bacterium K_Offshore_surface_m2_239]
MAISPFPPVVFPEQPPPDSASLWQAPALIYDYRQAANPIRKGLTDPIPYRQWSPPTLDFHRSSILPLDLSDALGCPGPATSPALAAHFLQVFPGDPLRPVASASSSLFVVLRGSGRLGWAPRDEEEAMSGPPYPPSLSWGAGDVVLLPHGPGPELEAQEPSLLVWVHDGPLLRHLGAVPAGARFSPCHFPADRLNDALERLLADPAAARGNRLSILLAHAELPASRTISPTLWAMVGLVPAGAKQPPHRHQSVALDLIVDCPPGCSTLVGTELDADGQILRPQRIDWEPGGVFVTPPGHWHAHVNNGDRPARLLPIQDAGLHTYLRSLDIRFAGGWTGEG